MTIIQQSAGAYITVIKACLREWMQCGPISSPLSHFVLFILFIRSSHMMGSLATSLITILRRLRQSSGSLMLGNLVSHPQRGVLQLFIYKDA